LVHRTKDNRHGHKHAIAALPGREGAVAARHGGENFSRQLKNVGRK
jgi:hypothetical protein